MLEILEVLEVLENNRLDLTIDISKIIILHRMDDFKSKRVYSLEKMVMAGETQNAEENGFPELSQARIAELEALLPEKPCGMGKPAADRAAWAPLAGRPDGQKVI